MPRDSNTADLGPADEAPTAGRLRWRRFLPFFGRPPALTRHQWRLIGVLGAANLIDGYDLAVMGLALPQIQQGLGIADADIGGITAFLRLGVVPAMLLTLLADHIGRRRLVLLTILGFTLSTFLTAFARDAREFAALQFLARLFIAGETMLSIVVIAEELDATTRGWGIGMLAALGSVGHGLASLVFALVNRLPFGWRALYVVGVVPLLLLAWFRRSLRETHRFEAHRRSRGERSRGIHGILQPLANLARMYPGRLLALCAALFPVAFVVETALLFVSKTLQESHGYKPETVALLYITVGAMAPIGNLLAGVFGDRVGRKRVLITGILVNSAAVWLFYNSRGMWVPPMFGLMLVTVTMVTTLFAALGSELFPTSYRSTASGVRQIIATAGAALGLWSEGRLFAAEGSHAAAISMMLVLMPVAPVLVGLFLPETANLELEAIAPEI
ncbi:MAG: MFS transporter [Deltaproteobacteria bacterium]|nr:MFS transporter [Deltaproteobacteria bacterium]